jgi:hypothetical protein
MTRITAEPLKEPFGFSYTKARGRADALAADGQGLMAVVEDLGDAKDSDEDRGLLWVMTYEDATAYCGSHNAEIVYDTGSD